MVAACPCSMRRMQHKGSIDDEREEEREEREMEASGRHPFTAFPSDGNTGNTQIHVKLQVTL